MSSFDPLGPPPGSNNDSGGASEPERDINGNPMPPRKPATPPPGAGTPPPANRPPGAGVPPANRSPLQPRPPGQPPPPAGAPTPPPSAGRDPNVRYDLAGNPLPSSSQPAAPSSGGYTPPAGGSYVPPGGGYVPPPQNVYPPASSGGYVPPGGAQNYGPRYTTNVNGGLILILGIFSIFCCQIILGPVAWIMGTNAMAAIESGRADPSQSGMANAGRICGIIGCIVFCLAVANGIYKYETAPAGSNPFSAYNRTYRYGGPGQPYSSDGSSNSSGSSAPQRIFIPTPAPSAPTYQPNPNPAPTFGQGSNGGSAPFYRPPVVTPVPTYSPPPMPPPPTFNQPPMPTPPMFNRPPMSSGPPMSGPQSPGFGR